MENVKIKNKIEIFKEFEKSAKENHVKRLDRDILNRFLIGHQYDIYSALKSIKNFESFVERRQNTWLKLETSLIERVIKAQIVEVLEKPGIQDQTIVWIRIGNWDTHSITADEILQVSGLLCELVYGRFKIINNIDIILDLHNFSLKHLYGLSPKFAKRMVFFLSACLPMSILHIYVVRQPKIFYLVYSLFKPFLEETIRKSIKVCGWNFELLQVTIGKDHLPMELDGISEHLDPTRWLHLFYNTKIQNDLQKTGYVFY